MDFSHTVDKAIGLADKALKMMQEKGIPPHPNNFFVWYCYCSREFPELNLAFEMLLNSSQKFDEERNATLYRLYCASPSEAVPVYLIAEKLEAELRTLLGVVEAAVANSKSYGDTLERAREVVLAVNHPEALRHLIAAIVELTRTVTQQTRELEKRLRVSSTEVKDLREQLEGAKREAMTDPLTGLANRKMFELVLRKAALDAVDEGQPLSIHLLDIDNFKLINDAYGHTIGDQVLKLLAATLRDGIKGQDTAARYGGEEFAIILPNTSLKDAARLADNIRQRVTAKTMINRETGNVLGRISVSIGVAQHRPDEPLRKLIERADKALYCAKRGGRNRVVSETEIDAETEAGVTEGTAAGAGAR